MCRILRSVCFFLLPLFVVLVTPASFAQSWISSVTVSTTNNAATINWTTAVPANSQVNYGTTTGLGTLSALNSGLTTAHSSSLTGLTAATAYHCRVMSADSTGVLVTSLDYTFTTLAPVNVSVSPATATVASGGSQQFSAQVTNTSNTAVTWSATAGSVSSGGLFSASTVTTNTTVTVKATSVADPTKYASATVTVTAPIGILTLNPTSLSFGSVMIGQTSPVLITTLTNTGNAPLTITSDSLSAGDFKWGGQSTHTCNYNILAPGASCTYSAQFKPTATGTRTGTITINSTASNSTLSLPLSGIGTTVGTLSVAPTTLSMGSVVVGQSGNASGTIAASGASVTVMAASTNSSVFSVGGLSLPVTIPAGQSVPFAMTFSPTVSGAVSATLTLTSNASPATATEGLTGTGTAAPTHSVGLSWNASKSSGVIGYNIYRAPYTTLCGSYAKVNSMLNTGTLYTDFAVANGSNYCYATTAVDSSNRESGYSNIVSNVKIPAF